MKVLLSAGDVRSTVGAAVFTFEKPDVARVARDPLVIARPTYTVVPIETVSVPITLHAAASDEREAVRVDPRRSSFSHTGAAAPPPVVVEAVAPVLVRR